MIIVAKIAVIIAALLLSAVITARLGFFKFGKTILGSIGKKPATLMYPVVPREWEERTRGSVSIDGDNCIACGMCASRCPAGITHPMVSLLARRLYGKYIALKSGHVDKRVQEVIDGDFDAIVKELSEKPLEELKELYNHRDIEK